MYNAEQAAPVSLHGFLWHSVWPVKPPDTLPGLPSPQEKPNPRGVFLLLSSPPRYKQATRGAWASQTSAVHMFGSNQLPTQRSWLSFSTVCAQQGEETWLSEWFMNVYACVWWARGGGSPASTAASSVKVSLCCQGLSLLAASLSCVCVCVWGRWRLLYGEVSVDLPSISTVHQTQFECTHTKVGTVWEQYQYEGMYSIPLSIPQKKKENVLETQHSFSLFFMNNLHTVQGQKRLLNRYICNEVNICAL